MARVRLGAVAGPGEEPVKDFRWLFHPQLMSCLATSVGLVGHDSSDAFGSPMDGRAEERPGEPLEARTRLTCGPCMTYTADVENVTPVFDDGGISLVVVYRMVGSEPITTAGEKLREVIIGDDVPRDHRGFYDPEDIKDDDVYFLLIGDSTIPCNRSRFVIPEGWSSRRPQSRYGDWPDTYAKSFCVYSIHSVEASFPEPLPDGYSKGSIVGLCESLEDQNESMALCRHIDYCMVDPSGLVITNVAVTLGPLYPGGEDNPFNASVVDDVTRALYTRKFFLFYTLKNDVSGAMEWAAATVEYLSKPVRATAEMTDPKGRKHDVGWNSGVEEIGWFYRKDPKEVKRPPYPTPATQISISAKLAEFGNPGFKGWRVVGGIKEGGVENEEAWTDVTVEEDPQVPDKRYDISAWDGRPIERSDAPENN